MLLGLIYYLLNMEAVGNGRWQWCDRAPDGGLLSNSGLLKVE